MKFANWKLKTIENYLTTLHLKSQYFVTEILNDLNLPLSINYTINRSETEIDWKRMSKHFVFFFDDKDDIEIERLLRKSLLIEHKNVILTYGWDEPVVQLPTSIFLDDWEGFIRSQLWQGFIFSDDFSLIIEVSRDYNMHSNFKILDQ